MDRLLGRITRFSGPNRTAGRTVQEMIGSDGQAKGWLPPGAYYRLGNDEWEWAYADTVEIDERKVIKGNGNYNLRLAGGIRLDSIPAEGIVQWRARQRFSTTAPPESRDHEDDPIIVKSYAEYEDAPFEADVRTGRIVQNSAGDRFNPPPVLKRKITVYNVSRLEIANPLWKSKLYSNVVNTEIFHGAMPGTLLMEAVSCDFDGRKWNVTYTIKERPEGWQTFLLDMGLNAIWGGRRIAILDDDGVPITEPVKLDGYGQPLPPQSEFGFNLGPFWKYQALPFAPLWLPNIFKLVSLPQ